MAGFFIWHNSEKREPESINKVFRVLDYKPGKFLSAGNWHAVVFQKTLYNIDNYLEFGDGFIFGTGTFGYKRCFYNNALQLLSEDIKNDAIDLTAFWGSFVIFYSDSSKTILIRDGAMLQRLYSDLNGFSFSNSFVGLLRTCNKKLTFNRDAATELLATGLIIGNETLINEIVFVNDLALNFPFKILYSNIESIPQEKTYEKVIKQHSSLLKKFAYDFSTDWFSYLLESKLNVSITGGLDSRLITAAILANHNNFDFYTYWRDDKAKDPDFAIASLIATHLNKKLHYKPVTYSLDMDELALKEIFRQSHNSCDGVIRPGSFWDEEFTTGQYRSGLAQTPYLRVTGFEGEYYRNMERLPFKSYRSLSSWIKWEMIYRFAGNNFNNPRDFKEVEQKISPKLRELIKDDVLNLYTFKEYYRRAVVPSYRALQNNVENKSGFIISPFADTFISKNAANVIPFLGKSLQFEIDLLKTLSMELAALPNDYNFSFVKGEKMKIAVEFWQLLPPAFKHRLFTLYRGYYHDDYILRLAEKHSFVGSLLDSVKSLGLPINIDSIILRSVRGKLVLNLGYFLILNEKWLKI
jgi:hypothetical protein